MPTSVVEFDASAMEVCFSEFSLRVGLADGREITVPLEFFPLLRDATPEQRSHWSLAGGGRSIHWDEIGEDLLCGDFVAPPLGP